MKLEESNRPESTWMDLQTHHPAAGNASLKAGAGRAKAVWENSIHPEGTRMEIRTHLAVGNPSLEAGTGRTDAVLE